jgi:hypothetical protein
VNKMISVVLIVTMMTAFSRAAAIEESGQGLLEMRQVAQTAVERNRPLTVLLKSTRDNSKKITGMPSNVLDNGFTLTNTKSGEQTQFDFDAVRQVRMKGSHVRLITGIGVGAGLALLVLLAFSKAGQKS